MKPSLLIMAAGMGSRYGALKQIDGIGPNDETILDYSIYDALRAGFNKIVFVIRKSFEKEFSNRILNRLHANGIDCTCVFQELNILPDNFTLPAHREKPWGTAHAVLMAKNVIHEPFAAINADDFYGREAYTTMCHFLDNTDINSTNYAMIGYDILATLSESGTVSRGVCKLNDNNTLSFIEERKKIILKDNILLDISDNTEIKMSKSETVSMNFWGFTPTLFDFIEANFINFLENNIDNLQSELYIPSVIYNLIKSNISIVDVLFSKAKWFGITYKEDKISVVKNINNLIQTGVYPKKLWK